jgi:hypothetical protein
MTELRFWPVPDKLRIPVKLPDNRLVVKCFPKAKPVEHEWLLENAQCFPIDCGADRNTLADYSRPIVPPKVEIARSGIQGE